MTEENSSSGLFLPAGSTAQAPFELVVNQESAGWGYSSLRVLTLGPGQSVEFETGNDEMIVLPLNGSAGVRIGGVRFDLVGRTGVFAAATDFAYLPIAEVVEVSSSASGTFALPGVAATNPLPFR